MPSCKLRFTVDGAYDSMGSVKAITWETNMRFKNSAIAIILAALLLLYLGAAAEPGRQPYGYGSYSGASVDYHGQFELEDIKQALMLPMPLDGDSDLTAVAAEAYEQPDLQVYADYAVWLTK